MDLLRAYGWAGWDDYDGPEDDGETFAWPDNWRWCAYCAAHHCEPLGCSA